jgi:CTP:molybdopterin cytidylyltransferase MocA
MHSPGVCGVILAAGSQVGAGDARLKTKAEGVTELIDALNGDTEMVLIAVGADAEELAPVAWARAAYVVQISETASDAETLRVMLQEVLNRGRDAALVTALNRAGLDQSEADHPLTAETVHRMVAAYCAAGDEIWAVVPETAMQQGHPVLMGRRMIELFLRGQKWSAADEILSANLEHVCTVTAVDPLATTATGAGWKAPWD